MTFGLAIPLAFLVGVLIADSGAGYLAVAGLALGSAAVAAAFDRPRPRLAILALVLLAAGGFWRTEQMPGRHTPQLPASQSLTLHAIVAGPPKRYTDHVRARLRLAQPPGELEVNLPPLPVVREGDRLRLRVTTGAGQPGQSAGVFVTSLVVERNSTSRVIRFRNWAADTASRAISNHIPEPAGSLTLGVVDGDDGGMTDATRLAFRRAGLSHITAVSGWNLALVALGAVFLLRGTRLPATARLAPLLAAIWGYAFLVGMDGSVVRAAAMSSLFLAARWRGRPADVIGGLLWGIAALVAITPNLRFDVGFQLSVAATGALALVAPLLVDRPWWQTALVVPATAELAVTPLTLHHFGTYSLLSPLSNLATELLVGPIMLGGALVTVSAWVSPALADMLGIAAWLPARLVVLIAEWTTRLGFGFGQTMQLSWTGTAVAYALLLSGWFFVSNRLLWSARYRRSADRQVV